MLGLLRKMESNMYIFAVSASLSAQVDNLQSQILKRRDQKKINKCLVGLKESLPQIFSCAYSVYCQKRLCKIKYGFLGLIFKCQFWPVLAEQPTHV